MPILNQIRGKEDPKALRGLVMDSILILLLGIGLGILSKFLDCTASNELPTFLEKLDARNFLGRFAIWVLLGIWISVCSHCAVRAAWNVFLFFFGMVGSYYLYSWFIAGFFPRSYALIWIGFTAISPLMAFVCWYARGKGILSFTLSVFLLGMLFWCSFTGGWFYVRPRSNLELLSFLCGVMVLRRSTLKDSALLTILGIALGGVFLLVIPFHFG